MAIWTEKENATGNFIKTNTKNFTPRRSKNSAQQNLNKLKKG